MSLLPSADGYADTTACLPQTSSNSGAEAVKESNTAPYDVDPGTGGNHPLDDAQFVSTTPTLDNERVTAGPFAFGSPAWCFFGVPGGSSNIQRELVVTCRLCRAKVRRGINPGKVGTTCLFTHLERRHGMTRQEVYKQASASGYCGPNTNFSALSSETGGGGSRSLRNSAPTKRPGIFQSSSDEDEDMPRCRPTMAPATSSEPPTTSTSDKQNQVGLRSSAYRQALRERLLGSVHMYCEVCHALVLSGERSQNVRDLALETHFSTNHPQMFRLLKSGAIRDVRLGGLGPFSSLPSGSLPSSVQR